MEIKKKVFKDSIKKTYHLHMLSAAVCILTGLLYNNDIYAATVVQRNSVARPTTATRTNQTARMPTMSISSSQQNTSSSTATEETTEPEETPEEETVVIEDKSSQFETILSDSSSSTTDSSDSTLADLIEKQKAAYAAQDAINTSNAKTQNALVSGQNACDTGLRKCMQEKCGNDFSKCKGDTDTTWGNKMDSCRRDTTCSGEEYSIFASEIKADRDTNAKLSSYNAVIDCGNKYNECIINKCGTTFSNCLGKTYGDAAIKECETIAKNCTQQDSGLAARVMEVFGTLRVNEEGQIKKDEERLYELRDLMRTQCSRLGALFDERSLDCVYTVKFYAGDDGTLYSSKKAYAGTSFNCTPNWFGIDVTTFKENAYRLTRSQTSATSSLMGAGLGVAAGAITSGAINRAIDRQKAENALDKAKDEYEENYGDQASKSESSKKETTDKESKENKTSTTTEENKLDSNNGQAPKQETGNKVNESKSEPTVYSKDPVMNSVISQTARDPSQIKLNIPSTPTVKSRR